MLTAPGGLWCLRARAPRTARNSLWAGDFAGPPFGVDAPALGSGSSPNS